VGGALVLLISLSYARTAADDQVNVLIGLPPIPYPADNPSSPAKVALGEKLFFETGLSSDHTVSCASCHKPDHFFADQVALSKGTGGHDGDHNSVSILNAAYATHLLWDGRSITLEDQVQYPVTHPREMANSKEKVVKFLAGEPSSGPLFRQAFGDEAVSWERLTKAIGSFERTLLTGNAAFDRYQSGDEAALSPAAKRGFELFRGAAGCIQCHSYTQTRPFFSDFDFHNTGVSWGRSADLGRYEITKAREDKGAFRTPSLRNVAATAPYMHDGRMASLREVIDFYSAGGTRNPFLDEKIKPLSLSERDKADLIAFLQSLTGEMSYRPHPGVETTSAVQMPPKEMPEHASLRRRSQIQSPRRNDSQEPHP
jgi:cytochrome c peroxidase